ncbi:MAG: hypothetical protein SFY80_02015 [Verrucomicrobiota bacterium]|nr:hypothetical protein [Verrucomicrobiota bacterium]
MAPFRRQATRTLLTLVSCFALTPLLQATSILSFNAASAGVTGSYAGNARVADTNTTSLIRYNFSTDSGGQMLNQGNPATTPAVYGGLEITSASAKASGYFRLHDNNPAAWPSAPMCFLQGVSSDATFSNFSWVNLWKKNQFMGTAATATVQFSAASTLAVHVTSLQGKSLRFIVRNANSYYISEYTYTGTGAATVSLADFNNNSTANKRWGTYTPTTTSFGVPSPLPSFAAVAFTDVREVGFIVYGSGQYSVTYGYDTFTVDGVIGTSPLSVGMNLNEVNDYSADMVFTDSFKKARSWSTRNQDGSGLWDSGFGSSVPVDTNGWPTLVPFTPSGQPAQIVHTTFKVAKGGTYKLIYDGVGTFKYQVANGTAWTTVNETITGTKTRDVTVTLNGSMAAVYLEILSSSGADKLRNFRFITPGYETTYTTKLFDNIYTDRLAPFTTLRFMDWGRTNGNTVVQWSERTTQTWYTQCKKFGVSYELMISLANQLGKNLWISIPHAADDNYVTQLARLLRDTANPDAKIFIEYSNETWNTAYAFTQTVYVQDQGQALNLDPNRWTAGQMYVGKRSARIFDIFETEFGTTNATKRLVKVMGTQAGSSSISTTRLSAMANPAINPTGVWPDALANAPYFGGGIADQIVTNGEVDTITTADILSRITTDLRTNSTNWVITQKGIADSNGLWLICYEGGQHLAGTFGNENNVTLTTKLNTANRDPGMQAIYDEYVTMLRTQGVTQFENYHYLGAYDKWGSWGMAEYPTQSDTVLYKYLALKNWINANPSGNLTPRATIACARVVTDTDNNGSEVVSLDALDSRDFDGNITAYQWKVNGASVSTASTYNATLPVGANQVQLIVTDNCGVTGTTTVTVTVNPQGTDAVIMDANFTGTSPGVNTPWTAVNTLAANVTYSGFSRGPGIISGNTRNNVFGVNVTATATPTTLASAIAENEYVKFTVQATPTHNLDLRGAAVTFKIQRFDLTNAGKRFAVFSSVGGFIESAALYTSPQITNTTEQTFTFNLPFTGYNTLTSAVEFRVYFYETVYATKEQDVTDFVLRGAVR